MRGIFLFVSRGFSFIFEKCCSLKCLFHVAEMLNDDDDDQLLQLDQDVGEGFAYDHVEGVKADKEGCSFNSYLQGLLYHFVAKPIVKYRWVVLGMYVNTV